MHTAEVASWGNVARGAHVIFTPGSGEDAFPPSQMVETVLPFGQGRSYGDSCLNIGGGLLLTRGLDRVMSFDRERGRITCEAGVLLSEILNLVVPHGWFLPVVPGTQHITVGGAIANDVHGKNHHRSGTFGRHVRKLELLRSSGESFRCAPGLNGEWFAATCGGLGLTGLILRAEIQLRPIACEGVDVESVRMENLDDFFGLSEESAEHFEYAVAWVDCLARGKRLGRGIFERANHCSVRRPCGHAPRHLDVPITAPFSLVNTVSLRPFNALRFHRASRVPRREVKHYESFFFPLYGIPHGNRLYGPRGFHQYQCVVPLECGREAVRELLATISRSGLGSFLGVLKQFGATPSPGLLSFPAEGVTLALDFPASGAKLERLLAALDRVVTAAGGRLYPAKDCRMPASLFQAGFPRWREFCTFKDPRCCSTFWRRVSQGARQSAFVAARSREAASLR
jgi:FAD/FMN-containing dehydrogenase